MDNLDFYLLDTIMSFLDVNSKIKSSLVNKYLFNKFFLPNKSYFQKFSIINRELCITCHQKTECFGYLVYLCNCSGKYPIQHHYCTLLNKFKRYTKIDKCPLCNDKVMIFLKEPRFGNMI